MPALRSTALPTVSALLALVLALPASAQAPAAPPLMPTRDVAVVYSVQPQGAPQPQSVKVYFHNKGDLMRIDGPPNPQDGALGGYMVMNRPAKTMVVILNQQHLYMDVPEGQEVQSPFVLDASMQFTPQGAGTVAGLPCERYSIVAGAGHAEACVTSDGVVLSETGVDGQGNRGTLTAQSVSYGPLDASLFAPPAGFQRAGHPAGPGEQGVPLQAGGLQGLPPATHGTP
ncbi:DUF4412 domain-containing protein [Acetobacteraceae bacterium KSS8]|uniref:DUF4412 domain-containing protein n=1 Tax=Endosaccharibacter trunci TaxID=2812733 RepID=A0ABT1W241_9PROT|nr:DUF4412 domain-containing protein [Acetobacteraceae bacterium KSS8]